MSRKVRWIVYSQVAGIFILLFGDTFSDGEPMFQIDWNNFFSIENLFFIILVQGFCLVLGYLYPITIDIFLDKIKK
jgi:hypothetical protein